MNIITLWGYKDQTQWRKGTEGPMVPGWPLLSSSLCPARPPNTVLAELMVPGQPSATWLQAPSGGESYPCATDYKNTMRFRKFHYAKKFIRFFDL